jgi:hypothetical protein
MKRIPVLRLALRWWLALTSLLSFLVGWALLAHAPKPTQSGSPSSGLTAGAISPLPTLAPLPELDLSGAAGSAAQPAPQFNLQPSTRFFQQSPLFTTGGS